MAGPLISDTRKLEGEFRGTACLLARDQADALPSKVLCEVDAKFSQQLDLFAFMILLFLFSHTNLPSIHYMISCNYLSIIFCLYQQTMNFILDTCLAFLLIYI